MTLTDEERVVLAAVMLRQVEWRPGLEGYEDAEYWLGDRRVTGIIFKLYHARLTRDDGGLDWHGTHPSITSAGLAAL